MPENNGKLGMWVRIGTCNRCGQCCDTERGIAIAEELRRKGISFTFPEHFPCPHFYYRGGKGKCRIYRKRFKHCQEFPARPQDLFGYPECGFMFVHELTGEIAKGKSL